MEYVLESGIQSWGPLIILSVFVWMLILMAAWELLQNMQEGVVDWIINKAKRTPYIHLGEAGNIYMERYWLVPYRNKSDYKTDDGTGWVRFHKRPFAWVLQALGIAVRVHCIRRSDAGRDFHNHPWPFITCILRGGYVEHRPIFDKNGFLVREASEWYGPGCINIRRSNFFHRLELPYRPDRNPSGAVWTLFITGWKMRTWGFNVCVDNVIPHYEYDNYSVMRGGRNATLNITAGVKSENAEEVIARFRKSDRLPGPKRP